MSLDLSFQIQISLHYIIAYLTFIRLSKLKNPISHEESINFLIQSGTVVCPSMLVIPFIAFEFIPVVSSDVMARMHLGSLGA